MHLVLHRTNPCKINTENWIQATHPDTNVLLLFLCTYGLGNKCYFPIPSTIVILSSGNLR